MFVGFKILPYLRGMKKLSLELSKIWPELMKGFEEFLNQKWLPYWEQTFEEWVKDKQTEEITKQVSPLFTLYLKKTLRKIGFQVKEGVGQDFVWEGIPMEGKLTLSKGIGWTGNGFPKTNWHLLVKFQFDKNGQISGSLVCLVPLYECKSSWTKTSDTNNFSCLKLLSEDYDKIIMVVGNFKKNPVYLRPVLV